MKKNTATWCIGLTAAVTLAMTFIQPTVIHQLVVWLSGLFAVVMVLALFVVGNWPQPATQPKTNGDAYLIQMTRVYRNLGYSEQNIATALNTDIDVIKAIP